jgi:hypothetical protein
MDASQLTFLGYGALIGLAVALWVGISGWRRRRDVEAELERLRRHLHDQMEITHEGAHQRKQEIERLRLENENLRVTLKVWQQKPDRRELRMLQVYDHALHQLLSNAPGFSPHWENALREAEQHVEQVDRGLLGFARRMVLPLTGTGKRREPPGEE